MIRGTTPVHTFQLPFERKDLKELRIIYGQNDKALLIKELNECAWQENEVKVKLTQQDTFKFSQQYPVQIQVRVLTNSDDVIASDIKLVGVDKCLEEEVI